LNNKGLFWKKKGSIGQLEYVFYDFSSGFDDFIFKCAGLDNFKGIRRNLSDFTFTEGHIWFIKVPFKLLFLIVVYVKSDLRIYIAKTCKLSKD